MDKLLLALMFGGRSTEHEVSVITALQAYENLDKTKYEIIPVYVSKNGDFYTGSKLLDLKNYKDVDALLLSSTKVTLARRNNRGGFLTDGIFGKFIPVDVAFLSFHGSFGEDGGIQGLFEIFQIPYTGFSVTGSAIGMDKAVSKALFKSLDLPIGDYLEIKRIDWLDDQKKIIKDIISQLSFPIFVKPGTIGSSIGVNKATDEDSLSFALEVAFTYSDKAVVEKSFENVIEINCSALGYEEIKASVCEMPIPSSSILSFADKYQKGQARSNKVAGMASASRVIPAPISNALAKNIQEATIKIFKAMDGCGVARVDYFVDKAKGRFWVNEVNTIPGSFSFYLWEKTGIKYTRLLDMLIEFALKRSENQRLTKYTFESGLLAQIAGKGGIKS